jgi:hypothetical protein
MGSLSLASTALALLCSVAALAAQLPIALETFPDHRVILRHEGYAAEWQLRLPEVVSAREGTFLTSTRTPMEWKRQPDGRMGYDWRGTEAYAKEAHEKMGRRLHMITGMEISPRIRASASRLDLELTLKNVSDATFREVWSDGGCLQHRTPRFYDDDRTHTWIFTATGLTPLAQLPRTIPVRAKYFVDPVWYEEPDTKAFEFFWGRSEARPAGALIVSEAAEGRGAIGIAWERCIGVRQNSDASHRCMHSSPRFGDLKPGESRTRRGVIWLGDTRADVVREFEKERLPLK